MAGVRSEEETAEATVVAEKGAARLEAETEAVREAGALAGVG